MSSMGHLYWAWIKYERQYERLWIHHELCICVCFVLHILSHYFFLLQSFCIFLSQTSVTNVSPHVSSSLAHTSNSTHLYPSCCNILSSHQSSTTLDSLFCSLLLRTWPKYLLPYPCAFSYTSTSPAPSFIHPSTPQFSPVCSVTISPLPPFLVFYYFLLFPLWPRPAAVQEERQRNREREGEVESTSVVNEEMPVEKILEAEVAVEQKTELHADGSSGGSSVSSLVGWQSTETVMHWCETLWN